MLARGWGKSPLARPLPCGYANYGDRIAIPCICCTCPLAGERKKGYSVESKQRLPPILSHLHTRYFLPTCIPRAGSHTFTCTLTHVRTIPRPAASRDTSPAHPNLPAPGSAGSPHPPALHVGAPRRQAAALPTEPLAGPRGGREGAAPGSDGQSGRPIEPRTASPKGGSGGSDGPNERGARVGLPPGIPLARIAGPWVTRKLGGRRRRPRFGSPVTDTGPPSPTPGRASRSPPIHYPGRPRAEAPPRVGSLCWARTPSFWWQQSRAVGAAARGRGAAGAGLRAPPGAAEPKSGEEEKRQTASGDRRGHSPLGSMRRAPSRARALAESQPLKSLPAAAQAASMAARPAARGG